MFKQLTLTLLLAASFGTVTMANAFADMGHGEHHHSAPDAEMHPDGRHGDEHGHGHHGALMVPADQPVPQVTLTVTPDAVAGWNVRVQTENWQFAPEHVNQASVTTEGHAHLYLNGEKLTRLYGTWYYLPSLPTGEHTLSVSLNANGHEALTYNGQPIEDAVVVTVP